MSMICQWQVLELEFQSTEFYGNPYMDTGMEVKFTDPDGKSISVPGFWDGGINWKVRFTTHHIGKWTWESSCLNVKDKGLHGLSGSFEVQKYIGNNRIYNHGFLEVNDHGRGFNYKNGIPFFWLGDTVWSCPSRATLDEWEEYTAWRNRQGFNIAQVNLLPQHDASGTDYRLPFEEGTEVWNLEKINVDYFKILDKMIAIALEKELFTAGVVLWFDYVPGTNPSWSVPRKADFTPGLAEIYGRYLAARYAALGMIWIITGDTDLENSYSMEVYDAAALAIKKASPYGNPMTAHLNGGIYTSKELNDKEWLDFHMYQASHNLDSFMQTQRYAEKDRAYCPARPVLNGEPPYENIGYHMKAEIIQREYVRKVAWQSILAGADAGITYGGHGLWSWHRGGEEFKPSAAWHEPSDWKDALKFEGADDFVRLKKFMEQFAWWKLEPQKDLFRMIDDRPSPVCAFIKDVLLAYVCEPVGLLLDAGKFTGVDFRWYNPADGAVSKCITEYSRGTIKIEKSPYPGDSVLRVEGIRPNAVRCPARKYFIIEDFEYTTEEKLHKKWYQWGELSYFMDHNNKNRGSFGVTHQVGKINTSWFAFPPELPEFSCAGMNAWRMWVKPDGSGKSATFFIKDGSHELYCWVIPNLLTGTEPYILEVPFESYDYIYRVNNKIFDPEGCGEFGYWITGPCEFSLDDIMLVYNPSLPDFFTSGSHTGER